MFGLSWLSGVLLAQILGASIALALVGVASWYYLFPKIEWSSIGRAHKIAGILAVLVAGILAVAYYAVLRIPWISGILVAQIIGASVALALVWILARYYALPRLLSWVIRGSRGRRWQRIVAVVTAVAAVLAVVGVLYIATSRIETGSSSLPYLRPVLAVVTSTYFYLLLGLVFLRRLLFLRRGLYARQAASATGLSVGTVKRLAEETRSPDGATRAILFSEDSIEEIRDRLRDALETGEDDVLSLRAVDDDQEDTDEAHNEGYPEPHSEKPPELTFDDTDDVALEDDRGDDPGDVDPFTEFELLRMDLGASINWSRVLWSFAVPAVAISGLIVLAMGIWVEPIVYLVAGVTGPAIGALNYLRIRLQLTRRLDSLRTEEESLSWSKLAVPVQRVETPEVTVYYGWLLGDTYATTSREELVDVLADRAKDKLDGRTPKPSILTKYADQLANYYPDLEGFRDDQKRRIMLELVDTVEGSAAGVLPRELLVASVVEYDRPSRFEAAQSWEGYDPAIVREAYEDLVPERLAEVDVSIDVDGEERIIRAVTSSINPVDPTHAQLRAEFSSLFANYDGAATPYQEPEPSFEERRLPRVGPVSIEDTDLEGVV